MFLITTKNIRPINKKGKIIYLGNWCISGKNPLIKNSKDHQIMSHHYDCYTKQHDDFIYINNIYELLLDELTKTLNEFHSQKWNKRQWRILIGPWLHKFLEISLDRWRLIEKAEKTYKIKETLISDVNFSDIYTSSYSDLSEKCKSDNWNQKIFDIIILFRNKIPYSKINNSKKQKQTIFKQNSKNNFSLREKFKLIFKRFILKNLFDFIPKNNKVSFINPYINFPELTKIKFLLREFPYKEYTIQYVENSSLLNTLRKIINLKFDNYKEDEYLDFCSKIIPYAIPAIYTNKFYKFEELVKKSVLNKNPKVIFTAESQWHDEVFKYWAAREIGNKCKLYIIQHGGSYGVNLFSFFEEHETKISDKFFVWGWANQQKKLCNIPINIIKSSDHGKWNKNGRLLVTTNYLSKGFVSQMHPTSHNSDKSIEYAKLITNLLENLISKINTKVTLRPYPGEEIIPYEIKDFEIKKKINISKEKLIKNEYYKSKLILCAYYFSSTFLECMALNLPCILMIDERFDPFRESIGGLIENLCKANICHKSIDSLCNHLKYVEDNIELWWESDEVNLAKNEFCDYFAYNKITVSEAILKILK